MGKNKNKQQAAPKPAAPAPEEAAESVADDDGYGYQGSDNEADYGETEARLHQALNQNPLRDNRAETSPPQRRRRFKITSSVDGSNVFLPAAALAPSNEPDDCVLFCIGLWGFVQAFIFGCLTPWIGIAHEAVMLGALGLLLLWVLWLSFCGGRSCTGSNISGTPYSVFLAASCFGALMGGVIGGSNQYTKWPKLF